MTQERTEIAGLAGQTIESIASSQSSYVGLDYGSKPLVVDATVLVLSDGRLDIENPYSIESTAQQGRKIGIASLRGCRVERAFRTPEELVLEISGGLRLSVSLRDEDYRTPEAASYSPNHGPILVFS